MRRKLLAAALFLLLISALFFSLSGPVKAAGESWLAGWTYRKSHVINSASGASTNYQIQIVAFYGSGTDANQYVYLGSNSRTDFGDVRFTDVNGSTLLDYWMESYNTGANATFWVEISANLTVASTTIYVYYGKSDATSAANGDATFLFFDDFSGADVDWTNKWESTDHSLYSLDTGRMKILYTATNTKLLNTKNSYGTGWAWQALVRVSVLGGQQINIVNSAKATYASIDYRYWIWNDAKGRIDTYLSSTVSINTGNRDITNYYKDLLYCPASGNANITITNTTAATMGTNFDKQCNTNSGTPTYRTGYFGFWSVVSGGINYLDDCFIRKYVSPEPTHGAWGTQEMYGTYYLNFSNVSNNSTMLGSSAMMAAYWSSNDTLNSYLFEWNFSGGWVSDSPVAFTNSTAPQWSNVTKWLGTNVTMWAYTVSWRINVTTTTAKTNSTGNQNFTLTGILVNYYMPDTGILQINGSPVTNTTHSQNWLADYYDTTPIGATYITVPHPSSTAYASAKGQTFNYTGSYGRLSEMTFWLKRSSTSPSGHLKAYFYAHSGTFGTSGIPFGNPLSISSTSLDVSTLTTTFTLYNFSFTDGSALISDQKYCATLIATDGFTDPVNAYVWVGRKSSGSTHAGNPFYFNTNTWTSEATTSDIYFYIYVNSPVIYPYGTTLNASSLPGTGYSFYNFTENSVYYNSNPSTITFPVTNFMANYASNFTMILGTGAGGGLNRIGPFSIAELAVITLICVPGALFILLLVLRRKK